MKTKDCDHCCYNHNPKPELKCNKTICCYLKKRKNTYECIIKEKEVKI